MHATPRTVMLALLLGLLLPAPTATPACAPTRHTATTEPTLPLLIDMQLVGMERGRGRARARLEIELRADDSLEGIDLSLSLPETVQVLVDAGLPQGLRMASGERRRIVLPVEGPDDRDLPIRLSGTFRTDDGRTFRLGQGVTLESRPPSRGRSHLGAWEVMAVPLEELKR
ncbi:MAG TPA: hypothetical protein VFB95_00145 [Candidatus Cryosericum sp.]|nr:hypothetical protein [Candidatus Cryosericum sp.]